MAFHRTAQSQPINSHSHTLARQPSLALPTGSFLFRRARDILIFRTFAERPPSTVVYTRAPLSHRSGRALSIGRFVSLSPSHRPAALGARDHPRFGSAHGRLAPAPSLPTTLTCAWCLVFLPPLRCTCARRLLSPSLLYAISPSLRPRYHTFSHESLDQGRYSRRPEFCLLPSFQLLGL